MFPEKFELKNVIYKEKFHLLRILAGKKHRQRKLQRLQKVQIWSFGLLVQQINSV